MSYPFCLSEALILRLLALPPNVWNASRMASDEKIGTLNFPLCRVLPSLKFGMVRMQSYAVCSLAGCAISVQPSRCNLLSCDWDRQLTWITPVIQKWKSHLYT